MRIKTDKMHLLLDEPKESFLSMFSELRKGYDKQAQASLGEKSW
jgi:hypothetical protein